MSNLSTMGGAALWVAVVFILMLAALTPVSVSTPAGQRASGTAQAATSAPSLA